MGLFTVVVLEIGFYLAITKRLDAMGQEVKSPPLWLQNLGLIFTIGGFFSGVAAIVVAFYISSQATRIDRMEELLQKQDKSISRLDTLATRSKDANTRLESLLEESEKTFKEIKKQLAVTTKVLEVSNQQLTLYVAARKAETRSNYFKLEEIVRKFPNLDYHHTNIYQKDSRSKVYYFSDSVKRKLEPGLTNPFLSEDSICNKKWNALYESAQELHYEIDRGDIHPPMGMAGPVFLNWERNQIPKIYGKFCGAYNDLRTYFKDVLAKKYHNTEAIYKIYYN